MITIKITSWEIEMTTQLHVEDLSPEGDYSHMAMVSKRLMERCNPERRRRRTAATAAATDLGGGGPCPPSYLEMVLVWMWFSTPRRLRGRRKFRGSW